MQFRHLGLGLVLFFSILTSALCADPGFDEKLYLARELLTRPAAKQVLNELLAEELTYFVANEEVGDFKLPRKKEISETQFLILLDQNPETIEDIRSYIKQVPRNSEKETEAIKLAREKWKERFSKILSSEEVRANFRAHNNPLEPYELTSKSGYSQVKTYVNHERLIDGKLVPGDDLKQVWIDNIRLAKKDISINVFDFDLEEVAEELIAAKKRGVKVRVGIDKGVIEARAEVKKVFDMLQENGVYVHAVDSVGLNHQKMMSIDSSVSGGGRVVFSSGNLTQSCLGKEGDLVIIPKGKRPAYSIPNANHVITMKSDQIASIVSHEISKTVDVGFQLRGKDYPLGGVYKINGAGKEKPYILLAFSPNGAMDNLNKNFIAQAIAKTEGPLKMVQFAFSSETIDEALFVRAKTEMAKKGKFVFKSVGDTPFAMMDWSGFLRMTGLELIRDENKEIPPRYQEIQDSRWRKELGEAEFTQLRRNVRVAPDVYGMHNFTLNNETYPVTSKIHHKLLITGTTKDRLAVTGSFNFSKGAESNQEYILMVKDERIVKELDGAADFLYKQSKGSVFEEALARNHRRNFEDAIPIERVEKANFKSAPQFKCKTLLNYVNGNILPMKD